MMYENLKRQFFGYSPESVGACIAQLNEDFSQQLLAAEAEHQNRVQKLEAQLRRLEEENRSLSAQKDEAMQALSEARDAYRQLFGRALELYGQDAADTQSRYAAAQKSLDQMSGELLLLQQQLADALEEVRRELQQTEQRHSEKEQLMQEAASLLETSAEGEATDS